MYFRTFRIILNKCLTHFLSLGQVVVVVFSFNGLLYISKVIFEEFCLFRVLCELRLNIPCPQLDEGVEVEGSAQTSSEQFNDGLFRATGHLASVDYSDSACARVLSESLWLSQIVASTNPWCLRSGFFITLVDESNSTVDLVPISDWERAVQSDDVLLLTLEDP